MMHVYLEFETNGQFETWLTWALGEINSDRMANGLVVGSKDGLFRVEVTHFDDGNSINVKQAVGVIEKNASFVGV